MLRPTHPAKRMLIWATALTALIVLIVAATVIPSCQVCSATEARRVATCCSIATLGTAIERFNKHLNRLPNTLEELTTRISDHPALLKHGSLFDAWGRAFQYRKISDSEFEVRSAGPDVHIGTEDDISELLRASRVMPAVAQAQFNYTTNNGTITITGYTGSERAVVIPSTVNGLPVTGIGNSAFLACTNMMTVVVPAGITTIGCGAFESCSSLTNITIPASVNRILYAAFYHCPNLTAVYFMGNAPALDWDLFKWAPTIPDHGMKSYLRAANRSLQMSDLFGSAEGMVYYLQGTTGWRSVFSGRPTAIWTPSTTNTAE